jgi:hypothetical protein
MGTKKLVLKLQVSLSILDLPCLHYKWILENDTKFLSFSGFTPLGAQQEFQGQTKKKVTLRITSLNKSDVCWLS